MMKSILLAAPTILLVTTATHADLACLRVESYVGPGWVENGFENLSAFRIYAYFTSPSDGLISVYGAPGDPMIMTSSDGVFRNDPVYDSLLPPCDYTDPPASYWANQWDTYVTLGDAPCPINWTGTSPGFAQETNNLASNFSTTNAAYYTTPLGPGVILAGSDMRILLGQFVVAEGESISGVLNLQYNDPFGNTWNISDQVVESPDPCMEDLNGDGAVDVQDLLELLGSWGLCVCCPADLDGDRFVNVSDLLQLLAAWGPCS